MRASSHIQTEKRIFAGEPVLPKEIILPQYWHFLFLENAKLYRDSRFLFLCLFSYSNCVTNIFLQFFTFLFSKTHSFHVSESTPITQNSTEADSRTSICVQLWWKFFCRIGLATQNYSPMHSRRIPFSFMVLVIFKIHLRIHSNTLNIGENCLRWKNNSFLHFFIVVLVMDVAPRQISLNYPDWKLENHVK